MRSVALSALLLLASTLVAQRTYLSATMEPCSKGSAAYYKEADGQVGGAYKARIYTMAGKLKAEGTYSDAQLKVPHGRFTFYHPTGKIESTGDYEMGVKAGVWKRFDNWGVALAEKIYDPKPVQGIVHAQASTMPEYPGGQKELVRYIRTKVDDKRIAEGTATASFIVEKDGTLSDVKVDAGDEAVKGLIEQALVESPKWQVGENGGIPVRVAVKVPIKY
jgi:hypothetical protein